MRIRHAACACLVSAAMSCASPHPLPPRVPAEVPPALDASVASYRYRVRATPEAAELDVDVDVPRGAPAASWNPDPHLLPYIRDVSFAARSPSEFEPVRDSCDGFCVPACAAELTCRLRYRVLLARAAHEQDDHDRAMKVGDAILSPPSAWLMRPRGTAAPFWLVVQTAPGDAFVTGLALAPAGHEGFRGDLSALDDTPYGAFGKLDVARATMPGGLVDVAFLQGKPSPRIATWVDGALGAMAAYYGRFPIDHAALLVTLERGRRVGMGRTMGHGGGAVLITVGEHADAAALADDWVLIHELVHVSFPEVGAIWAEEGIATYLEPIIRLRSHLCDADLLWRSLVEGLPKGQPDEFDRGLDATDTWGRRYWGGAMFWFLADVEIRERTHNARSLDDVLRAVNRAGGNVGVRWDLDRVLALGDEATGVSVLLPLRRKLGDAPVTVDLDAVWKRLGVAQVHGRMVYDDAAPLAAVRRGIMAGDTARMPGAARN
jgi:hypothetical protein